MVQSFESLDAAERLAEFGHYGQLDKAGHPYIRHPRRVMGYVQDQGALPYVQVAAMMHDLTEDTTYTPQMLLDLGFSEAAVEIVRLCDRKESRREFHELNQGRDIGSGLYKGRRWYLALGYDGEDRYYYQQIKTNPGAVQVKLADIHDNTLEWRLNYLPAKKQKALRTKYDKALDLLS